MDNSAITIPPLTLVPYMFATVSPTPKLAPFPLSPTPLPVPIQAPALVTLTLAEIPSLTTVEASVTLESLSSQGKLLCGFPVDGNSGVVWGTGVTTGLAPNLCCDVVTAALGPDAHVKRVYFSKASPACTSLEQGDLEVL